MTISWTAFRNLIKQRSWPYSLTFGNLGSMPLDASFDKLTENFGKSRFAPSGGWRFFYVTLAPDLIYVLHAYKKQGRKAPRREIGVALKRLKEVLR